jgi:DNA polymerase III delta prime subunit
MTMSEYLYVEKYRPHKIEDCILPDRLKNVFQEYVKNGEIPNLLLSGPAGCGKTTAAMAMCDEIGCNYLFINSSDERGIDVLRTKVVGYASTVSLTGGRKVIILDEADGLTPDTQDALRGVIEKFSSNCSFIFTCNFKAKIKDAIHSRCAVVDFALKNDEKAKMATQMFKRITNILNTEGVTYDKAVVVKLVEKYFPDYRRTLNELQRHSISGSIDASVVSQLDSVRSLNELIKCLKDKDFSAMRKWVVMNSDIDPTRIYRSVYDGLNEYLKPESIPAAVVTLAKYQYQGAFVADQELNLVACLTEIMVECEVK